MHRCVVTPLVSPVRDDITITKALSVCVCVTVFIVTDITFLGLEPRVSLLCFQAVLWSPAVQLQVSQRPLLTS